MQKYGYARVSTNIQDLERQRKILLEQGIEEKNIFCDIATGKDFNNRTQYFELIDKTIQNGDIIYIVSLDRLGRNIQAIEEQYKIITSLRGCKLISINEPFLQSTGIAEVDNLLNPIILKIISWFAERERNEMLKRQKQAYQSMKKDEKGYLISNRTGKKLGRQEKINTFSSKEKKLIKDWIAGKISCLRVAEVLKISRPTLYKIKKMYNSEEIEL